jgi:hypothetical protein
MITRRMILAAPVALALPLPALRPRHGDFISLYYREGFAKPWQTVSWYDGKPYGLGKFYISGRTPTEAIARMNAALQRAVDLDCAFPSPAFPKPFAA